ncbi:Formiminotransferase subdomain-containing protein [Baffinella frigidus]|nr:Formiminotransferase subdomain-containing protein [Cryptophyta sp. CCMP2293]
MLKRAAVCCFANVQEGRSPRILREIAEAAGSVPGAALVRVFSDRTFDRSGLCILGEGEAVGDAVVAMVTKALERIDLTSEDRQHNNRIHHHIGAVDLLPFHPIGSASLEDAAAVSRSVAMRLGRDLHLPVLLYGER